jgi:CrcB protein
MWTLAWIGVGGAIGATLRYLSVLGIQRLIGASPWLPWGTFAVNVVGSFAAGALVAWLSANASSPSMARPFLLVGVLGGFTTFSAFSVEILAMLQAGRWLAGVAYAAASVLGCVAGAWIGFKCST